MDKKFKIIAYIILITLTIIFVYVIFSKATQSTNNKIEDKVLTEVKFLESKIIEIANQLNNITVQNYKVTTSEIKNDSTSTKSSSSSDKESKTSSGSSEQENKEASGESKKEENSKNKEFNLEKIDTLKEGKEEKIKWDILRINFQEIYTAMPTITLDLYQTNVNQENILNFNKELDDAAISIKSENKQKTLDNLCKLYSYIVNFAQVISKEEEFTKAVECKESILKAYSKIDSKNWDNISKDVQDAINKFSTLLTNANIEGTKQYNNNKVYVILNELKNVVNKQDREVFYLKYRNLIEEMKSV